MTYAFPASELAADAYLIKIAEHAKQGSAHRWKFSKVHTGPHFCTQLSTFLIYTVQATSRSHTKS
jgi:hypothetical protein